MHRHHLQLEVVAHQRAADGGEPTADLVLDIFLHALGGSGRRGQNRQALR